MKLPNNKEENFCIKYYPELYNLTSNKSEAVTFDLNQLYELPQDANTCPDEEDIDDLDPNQIALIPTTNKTINGKLILFRSQRNVPTTTLQNLPIIFMGYESPNVK